MSGRNTPNEPANEPFPQTIAARILEHRMPIYYRTYRPGELQFITTSTYRRLAQSAALRPSGTETPPAVGDQNLASSLLSERDSWLRSE